MAKADYKTYVTAMIKLSGYNVSEVAQIAGITKGTLYKHLGEPDRMDRGTLRVLHKYCGIPYEELLERR